MGWAQAMTTPSAWIQTRTVGSRLVLGVGNHHVVEPPLQRVDNDQKYIKPVKFVDLVNYWYHVRVTPADKGNRFERHRA